LSEAISIIRHSSIDISHFKKGGIDMSIEGVDIVKAAAFIGAGISMGLGAIGPGVGEGMVAAKACEAIGKNPKEAGLLTRTMLVGQAVSESTGIYSLVVALLLLFVV
jgi:F-type H+-transporting ATPase subunit c